MPEISHSTMVFAIQAIAREVKELQQTIDNGDAVPEDFPMMDDLQDAARELEREYDKAARSVINLPPYDELVNQ
jgi:hypothetical protein